MDENESLLPCQNFLNTWKKLFCNIKRLKGETNVLIQKQNPESIINSIINHHKGNSFLNVSLCACSSLPKPSPALPQIQRGEQPLRWRVFLPFPTQGEVNLLFAPHLHTRWPTVTPQFLSWTDMDYLDLNMMCWVIYFFFLWYVLATSAFNRIYHFSLLQVLLMESSVWIRSN